MCKIGKIVFGRTVLLLQQKRIKPKLFDLFAERLFMEILFRILQRADLPRVTRWGEFSPLEKIWAFFKITGATKNYGLFFDGKSDKYLSGINLKFPKLI
jgi:hypothetical protein